MWYTVWKPINSTTYKFYMASEVADVALSHAHNAVVTKTPHRFSFNYMHTDDLKNYHHITPRR